MAQAASPVLPDIDSCAVGDSLETASAAGLHYVSDAMPGIQRKRAGQHFSYLDADGRPIRNPDELQRIKSLSIPPAWTHVWICPSPQGHLQATGRDAKGRKQYRYHSRWREIRDATKYEHIIAFGETLPSIRERTNQDLALAGLPRAKVLATVVRLLDTTMIRVGNEEYTRENRSFGLTTLHNRHVAVNGSKLHFHFRGKGGKEHEIEIQNKQLASIVKRCQELPGYELFEYIDEHGEQHALDSSDVNDYIREISTHDFTAKDFRTWGGTVIAAHALEELGDFETQTQAKKNVVQAIQTTAEHLGNTAAICRKCYVHPAIIDAYLDGSLLAFLRSHTRHEMKNAPTELRPDEAVVLAFLQQLP